MTSAQVVETSVNVISNSPSQDYTHPDDRTLLYDMTPGFKPFTTGFLSNRRQRVKLVVSISGWLPMSIKREALTNIYYLNAGEKDCVVVFFPKY